MPRHIARLNADGSPDLSFDPGASANRIVYSLALQPDGKVLMSVDSPSYDGVPRYCMARLNADGSFDTVFDLGTGVTNRVYSLALQPDGKILVGGTSLATISAATIECRTVISHV